MAAGIPNVKWSGVDGNYNVLAMDLLGENLEELLKICGNKLSLKSVLMLADQMVSLHPVCTFFFFFEKLIQFVLSSVLKSTFPNHK